MGRHHSFYDGFIRCMSPRGLPFRQTEARVSFTFMGTRHFSGGSASCCDTCWVGVEPLHRALFRFVPWVPRTLTQMWPISTG